MLERPAKVEHSRDASSILPCYRPLMAMIGKRKTAETGSQDCDIKITVTQTFAVRLCSGCSKAPHTQRVQGMHIAFGSSLYRANASVVTPPSQDGRRLSVLHDSCCIWEQHT